MLAQLGRYLRESKNILDDWGTYSDENTGLDGWPYDDHAYGLRASRRDADTAAAFENIRDAAHHLLATAQTQLTALPARSVQNRWVWQLSTLYDALDRLDALHDAWLQTQDSLPAEARPGTALFDDTLAAHHADAWSHLDDWATHGHAILDIHAAARLAPSTLAPPPPPTAVPFASRAGTVPR